MLNIYNQTVEVSIAPAPPPNSTCRYCSTDKEDMDITLELLPDEEDSDTDLRVSDTDREDIVVIEVWSISFL